MSSTAKTIVKGLISGIVDKELSPEEAEAVLERLFRVMEPCRTPYNRSEAVAASTEKKIVFPAGTRRFSVQLAGVNEWRYSWIEGETNNKHYTTVRANESYYEDMILLDSDTPLFIWCASTDTVQVTAWF